ncbi:MAG TPA: hypothetical protein ENJ96_07130 [Thermodesulfatator atlanticus]|uniref:Uncharacterized protein n=1 Tax=Thermodesulfatator atlanticus TaxID=501497 RepID=A0A7V5P0J9_9BACT|nr:hypothetical protein [Thermodesulfatator atlanticus]
MGEEIKSTLEIVLEKVEKLGKASKEELRREELIKEGRRLAAKFLNEKDFSLLKALAAVKPEDKPLILRGVVDTLVRNIVFPRDEHAIAEIERALLGLEQVFAAFPQVKQLTAEIKKLLLLFYQQQKQIYEQFKQQFKAQFSEVEEALKEQYGEQIKVDIEMQPKFQEEWRKIKGQLEEQYRQQLDYLKGLFYKMLPA